MEKVLDSINDAVFGKLSFNDVWVREIDLTFFGAMSTVELIVEGNDDNEAIFDEQRDSFRKLSDTISEVEDEILEYYQSICDDFRARFGDDADARMPIIDDKANLQKLVRLTGVVFPMVRDSSEFSVGFLLECSWDPEHGVGVKIVNDKIEAGTQDLVT